MRGFNWSIISFILFAACFSFPMSSSWKRSSFIDDRLFIVEFMGKTVQVNLWKTIDTGMIETILDIIRSDKLWKSKSEKERKMVH